MYMDKTKHITAQSIKSRLEETFILMKHYNSTNEQIKKFKEIANSLPNNKLEEGKGLNLKGTISVDEAKFAHPVRTFVDLQKELDEQIVIIGNKIKENRNLINIVPNSTISYILKERFILNKNIDDIARSIDKSPSSIYRLINEGLEIIAKKLNNL